MPGALGKSLIKYFEKEEPSSQANSLKDLCRFSASGVASDPTMERGEKAPGGPSVERPFSWHSRCPSWTRESPKANPRRQVELFVGRELERTSLELGWRPGLGQLSSDTEEGVCDLFVFISTPSPLPLPSGLVLRHLKKKPVSLEEGTFPLASTSVPMKNH